MQLMGLLLSGLVAGTTGAATTPPDLFFSVAYRQREGSELSKSVHLVKFTCLEGQCDLITLTLNQCFGEEKVLGVTTNRGKFYPQIERASTIGGDLAVKMEAPGVIVAEWLLPSEGATITHRFVYAEVKGSIRKLIGFSGATVKLTRPWIIRETSRRSSMRRV